MQSFRRGRIRLQRDQGTRCAGKVREELMAEDALRRREDYLRATIDTIPEAVGDAELVEYFHAGDPSAMVLVTSRCFDQSLDFKLEATPLRGPRRRYKSARRPADGRYRPRPRDSTSRSSRSRSRIAD